MQNGHLGKKTDLMFQKLHFFPKLAKLAIESTAMALEKW